MTAIAHAQEFEVDRIDVEAGFVLQGEPPQSPVRLASGEPLSVRELPAVERMATCVRIGLPERAHLITAKIGVFLEANGRAEPRSVPAAATAGTHGGVGRRDAISHRESGYCSLSAGSTR